jgi:hypothetical protein
MLEHCITCLSKLRPVIVSLVPSNRSYIICSQEYLKYVVFQSCALCAYMMIVIPKTHWPTKFGAVVVGFTTTCASSKYHYYSYEFKFHSWRCVLDMTLCDDICHWLAISRWFTSGLLVSANRKTDRYIRKYYWKWREPP